MNGDEWSVLGEIDAGMRAWVAEHGDAPSGQAWSLDGLTPEGAPIGFTLVNVPGFPAVTGSVTVDGQEPSAEVVVVVSEDDRTVVVLGTDGSPEAVEAALALAAVIADGRAVNVVVDVGRAEVRQVREIRR